MSDSSAPPPPKVTSEPRFGLLNLGGVLGTWTLPATLVGWDAFGGTIPRDWYTGLFCLAFASVPLGLAGGGFGAGYAEAIVRDREWNLSDRVTKFGGAFVGGAAFSAILAAALLVLSLSAT